MATDTDKLIVGCLGVLLLFFLILPICFTCEALIIYFLMNVLLPFLGIVYPLTWAQCFVAAIALSIIGFFTRHMFGRSSS